MKPNWNFPKIEVLRCDACHALSNSTTAFHYLLCDHCGKKGRITKCDEYYVVRAECSLCHKHIETFHFTHDDLIPKLRKTNGDRSGTCIISDRLHLCIVEDRAIYPRLDFVIMHTVPYFVENARLPKTF